MQAVTRFWLWLTRPHPSITDIEQRRQSRLLAAILIVLGSTTILAGVLLAYRASVTGGSFSTPLATLPMVVFLGIFLALNRSGRYQLAAFLFIVQTFLAVHLLPLVTKDLSWLAFANLLLVLSGLLLPLRAVIGVFVLSVITQIGLTILAPGQTSMSNIGFMIVLFVTSPVLLTFIRHRSLLENERQGELRAANQKLRASEAELQQTNATLEQRVKDRTVELEQAKEVAERANLVKSSFLASMSHELRTPLNAIINFTKFVAKGDMGEVNPEQEEALGEVVKSGKHLLNLINDVLDMSKIEAGSLTLFVEDDVDLKAILNNVATTGKVLLADKSVVLKLDVADDLPTLRADRQRILQILLNIMSNACKFTEAGTITLRARRVDQSVVISVQDSGPGIAVKDQPLVFEAFKQTDTGLRQGGGTGLGMPISRSLVEAHGGKMWLESQAGQGATFFVQLPVHSESLVPMLSMAVA